MLRWRGEEKERGTLVEMERGYIRGELGEDREDVAVCDHRHGVQNLSEKSWRGSDSHLDRSGSKSLVENERAENDKSTEKRTDGEKAGTRRDGGSHLHGSVEVEFCGERRELGQRDQ